MLLLNGVTVVALVKNPALPDEPSDEPPEEGLSEAVPANRLMPDTALLNKPPAGAPEEGDPALLNKPPEAAPANGLTPELAQPKNPADEPPDPALPNRPPEAAPANGLMPEFALPKRPGEAPDPAPPNKPPGVAAVNGLAAELAQPKEPPEATPKGPAVELAVVSELLQASAEAQAPDPELLKRPPEAAPANGLTPATIKHNVPPTPQYEGLRLEGGLRCDIFCRPSLPHLRMPSIFI